MNLLPSVRKFYTANEHFQGLPGNGLGQGIPYRSRQVWMLTVGTESSVRSSGALHLRCCCGSNSRSSRVGLCQYRDGCQITDHWGRVGSSAVRNLFQGIRQEPSADDVNTYRYQPGGSSGFQHGSDPLSNGTNCLRDAALMQSLGVNAIRVYNLDPTVNHDECASIFNAVGIYMMIDVNSPLPNESLVPTQLASSYSTTYLQHIFGVVEAFHNYDNTLAFVGGNEDMNVRMFSNHFWPHSIYQMRM